MIWLIGNRGMLGSEIEKQLILKKLDYTATDMDCDITSLPALNNFADNKKIEWIVNCSAYTAVDAAEDNRETAYKINAEGTGNIAEIAKTKGAALIHISTDYVFNGSKKEPYTENDPIDPQSIYGASKAAGEKEITETVKKFFVIRTAWLYGRNGNNFVKTMLRLFKEKDSINVVDDQFGSPTYAPDLAETVIEFITRKSKNYGIYHYSNEGKISWFDFAEEIYNQGRSLKILDSSCTIHPVSSGKFPTKAKRPVNSVLCKDKIIEELNISVPFWKDSLKNYLKKEKL